MNERLIQVMEHYGFSPSLFADEIGVLRSSISHILSGRNKPGLDLIQKVLTRFTNISSEWLLLGHGSMLKAEEDEAEAARIETNELPSKPKPQDMLPLEFFIERSKQADTDMPVPENNTGSTQQAPVSASAADNGQPEMARESQADVRPQHSEPRLSTIQLAAKSAKVKRITLYYDDNTFQDFLPDNG